MTNRYNYKLFYFNSIFLFFYIVITKALGPRDFCKQYIPRAHGPIFIKPEPGIELSNLTDNHYYGDPEQTSAPTYISDGIPMFKFMLTKEEEEEEERRKHNQNIGMRRI